MAKRAARSLVRIAAGAAVIILAGCSRGPVTRPPAPVPTNKSAGTMPGIPRRTPPTRARAPYRGTLDAAISEADLDSLWLHQLMVPVEGRDVSSIDDNFAVARAGRVHGALDIMAKKATPVLAADDCIIGRMFSGPIGGIVIYATDLSGQFVYYYAHLDRYRRGLAVGDQVAKGSIIGYVGSTGNASANAPHLHFQVMKRGIGRMWWDGPPINPTTFLAISGRH